MSVSNNLLLRLINEIESESKLKKILIISTTVKIISHGNHYFTPIRKTKKIIALGIVIDSLHVLDQILTISNLFDYIFIDHEKKLFGENKHPVNIETYIRSFNKIDFNKIIFFKANDITVDSVYRSILDLYCSRMIAGSNILVIGIGNIGFKTSLKLLESGASIFLSSTNQSKVNNLISTLNQVKPNATLAKANIFQPGEMTCFDVIIGCNLLPVKIDFSNHLKSDSIIIDVSKGAFDAFQIEFFKSVGATLIRLSVENDLLSTVESLIGRKKNHPIRVFKDGYYFISGGLLGDAGDIVVNDANNIKHIYGIANGAGDFLRDDSSLTALMNLKIKYEK